MAPLPQNTTARVFFDYVTGDTEFSQEHTLGIRVAVTDPATDLPDIQDAVLELLDAIGSNQFWENWRILRCRYQAEGANFSLPVDLNTALGAFVGTGNAATSFREECQEWSIPGRGFQNGRRGRLVLYGLATGAPGDLRLTPTDQAWVAFVVGFLNGWPGEPPAFLMIDGDPGVYYPYVNFNYNSHWERALRN